MSAFRFIHTSDIHLGSLLQIRGAESPRLLQFCREATFTAFDRICGLAVEKDARFIVIAGDLYDKEARSVKANRFFAEACQRLHQHGIEVYIAAGNHDPLSESRELFKLPPNVHIFDSNHPEVFPVTHQGELIAQVIGQSYHTKWEPRALHTGYPVVDTGVFHVGVLHTQLVPHDRKYVPAAVTELLAHPSIHYWALGHIHQASIVKQGSPMAAYAGIPQGRDFGEEGPGGCWLIEVEGCRVVNTRFMRTSPVIYQKIEIDIGEGDLKEASSITELEDYIIAYVRERLYQPSDVEGIFGYVIQWVIAGHGLLHDSLRERQEAAWDLEDTLRRQLGDLHPFIWTDAVLIRTHAPIQDQHTAQHPVLHELLDRVTQACLNEEICRNELISRLGQMWTSSMDHEEGDDLKLPLDQETLERIICDARQLLLERLLEGRE